MSDKDPEVGALVDEMAPATTHEPHTRRLVRRAVEAGRAMGERHRHELIVLLGRVLDVVAEGAAISDSDWERACLLGGRYMDSHLNSSRDAKAEGAREATAPLLKRIEELEAVLNVIEQDTMLRSDVRDRARALLAHDRARGGSR